MDRSIRDKSRRRRFLLASVTAAGAFVVVYFANAAYHELLLDKLGLSQALVDALGAAAAVLELQWVGRQDLGADFETPLGIKQHLDARPRVEAIVMAALRADLCVLLQVRRVQHGFAGRTLAPQTFRERGFALDTGIALDLRRQRIVQPAHG